MLALEYDPELARQAWIEFCSEQGFEQGIEKNRKEFIEKLLAAKTPIKYIITATGLTEEQILELAKD